MEKIQFYDLQETLKTIFGKNTKISGKKRIYGGSINDSWVLFLSNGEKVFMKTNAMNKYPLFAAEEQGLRALRSAKAVRVPELFAVGTDKSRGFSFLLLEYIESAAPAKGYWETFGRNLAQMHKADCSSFVLWGGQKARFGFKEDNYIGMSAQKNTAKEKWADFYRECRLMPQIKMAGYYFDAALKKQLERLLENIEIYIREPEFPSLVHGDLWGGNILCGENNKAWLVDPAAYVGDYETDLAMTELFGRFPQTFYDAYYEINPLEEGYEDRRKIYQLYHLLNHLNLFGRVYLESIKEIIKGL